MFATLTLPAGFAAGYDMGSPLRSPTVRVRSADDLRSALRQAREQPLSLDGSGLDRVLHLDAKRGLVELQAATPWSELVKYLASRKIAINSFAASATLPATVGEAVSQSAAGPDGLPVSAHVASVMLFTPEGELRRADREVNRELFRLVLGGQGAIGVLYSVTLSIESLAASAAAAAPPVELVLDAAAGSAPQCAIECLLPPEALDAYLAEVRTLAEERRIPLYGITVRRYRGESDAALRWAGREWAGVEVRFGSKTTLGACVAAAEVRRALLAAALALGGSFPIRDLRDATRVQLEACYPMIGAFIADKRLGDPGERLQNHWYRSLVSTMRCKSCDVRWRKD